MRFMLHFTVFSLRLILYATAIFCAYILHDISEGYIRPFSVPERALCIGVMGYSFLYALHLTRWFRGDRTTYIRAGVWAILLFVAFLYVGVSLAEEEVDLKFAVIAGIIPFEIVHYLVKALSKYYFSQFPDKDD